MRRLGQ